MKTTFTYTVLRYVHDIATGEFVNMGVALYAPEAKYVSAICNSRYGRLSKMFLEVNGDNLRSLMRYIQARFEEHAAKLNSERQRATPWLVRRRMCHRGRRRDATWSSQDGRGLQRDGRGRGPASRWLTPGMPPGSVPVGA